MDDFGGIVVAALEGQGPTRPSNDTDPRGCLVMKRGLCVLFLLLCCRGRADASSVLIGTPGNRFEDCVSFGCGIKAQFIYDASYFSGPVTITGIRVRQPCFTSSMAVRARMGSSTRQTSVESTS